MQQLLSNHPACILYSWAHLWISINSDWLKRAYHAFSNPALLFLAFLYHTHTHTHTLRVMRQLTFNFSSWSWLSSAHKRIRLATTVVFKGSWIKYTLTTGGEWQTSYAPSWKVYVADLELRIGGRRFVCRSVFMALIRNNLPRTHSMLNQRQ